MREITLLKTDTFKDEFFVNYSKFKHGSKTQAREFGRQLANVCDFPEKSTLVFYAAPYNNVPAASNALKDYLLSYCSNQFIEKDITIKQSKIFREYSYDDDYGKMGKEERIAAISSDMMYLDKSCIRPGEILVFVDDIKITGSHEVRIKEILERERITNQVIFLYLAVYTGNIPSIENDLNHRAVYNLRTVNDIIRNEKFIFNIRVVKYILRADVEEFVSFITYQGKSFQETLFNCAVINSYHNNKKYSANFSILKNYLEKK